MHVLRSCQHKHRRIRVIIAIHGTMHCDVDHQSCVRRCSVCGTRLPKTTVAKTVLIDGEDILVDFNHNDNTDDIVEFARDFIDQME
ncbi:hypothetical protein ACFLZO_00680 [Patescibacteria group bacterium]